MTLPLTWGHTPIPEMDFGLITQESHAFRRVECQQYVNRYSDNGWDGVRWANRPHVFLGGVSHFYREVKKYAKFEGVLCIRMEG